MHCQFFFSSDQGDQAINQGQKEMPLLLGQGRPHAFLTLDHYCNAIADTLLGSREKIAALVNSLPESSSMGIDLDNCVIRIEKQGALYLIASAEFFNQQKTSSLKLALTAAVSNSTIALLKKEFALLQQLQKSPFADRLQKIFFDLPTTVHTSSGTASFYFVIGHWFTNFHEWHAHSIPDQNISIRLWDNDKGHIALSNAQCLSIFRQASFILTGLFDTRNYCQIYPWHHAAGDFIVKASNEIEVRLITVREYAPYPVSVDESMNPFAALLLFLLNLTIRMRLDKIDGVGKIVWFDKEILPFVLKGFCEALEQKSAFEPLPFGSVDDFLQLAASFSSEDLEAMYAPLLASYSQEAESDMTVISANLPAHTIELREELERLTRKNQGAE